MRGAEHAGDWLVWVAHQIWTRQGERRIEDHALGEHGNETEIGLGNETYRLEI